MRMLMIGGGGSDMVRLRAVLLRAGIDVGVHRLSEAALQARVAAARGARVDVWAGSETGDEAPAIGESALDADTEDSPPRALLFEAWQRPDLAGRALVAVRAHESFEATVAIVSLDIEGGDWLERVRGFDDFVAHPWSAAELLGRIGTVELRRGGFEPGAVVQIGGIWMDQVAHQAQVNGRPVHLTAREFALLSYLCTRRGCVLSRNHLLAQVWGRAYSGGQRTVDVHIRRLRSKLGPNLPIDTVRSGGYRLRAEPQRRAEPGDGAALA
jgi:DNA-binding response OmpR family regulator